MAKYRKKPIEVEAVQISELLECAQKNWNKLPEWVIEGYGQTNIVFMANSLYINNRPGSTLVGKKEDWLIRDKFGSIDICEGKIFKNDYEIVDTYLKKDTCNTCGHIKCVCTKLMIV